MGSVAQLLLLVIFAVAIYAIWAAMGRAEGGSSQSNTNNNPSQSNSSGSQVDEFSSTGIRKLGSFGVAQVTTEYTVAFFNGSIRGEVNGAFLRIFFLPFHDVYAVVRRELTLKLRKRKFVFTIDNDGDGETVEAEIAFEMSYRVIDPVLMMMTTEHLGNTVEVTADQATSLFMAKVMALDVSSANPNTIMTTVERVCENVRIYLAQHLAQYGVELSNFGATEVDLADQLLNAFSQVTKSRLAVEARIVAAKGEQSVNAALAASVRRNNPNMSEADVAKEVSRLRVITAIESSGGSGATPIINTSLNTGD